MIVRSGDDLLRQASGLRNDVICTVPSASILGVQERNILLSPGPTDKHEFHACLPLFYSGIEANRWINVTPGNSRVVAHAPGPVSVPRIFLGRGVASGWQDWTLDNMIYIAVVAGIQGAEVLKLLVASTTKKLASLVFGEALNGYSNIFSGACLESEWYDRRNGRMEWKMAQSLDELEQLRERRWRGGVQVAGILC